MASSSSCSVPMHWTLCAPSFLSDYCPYMVSVTCLLKAGLTEPEKTPVVRQWLRKHVSLTTDMHTQQYKNC
jgi:hypothetical protein